MDLRLHLARRRARGGVDEELGLRFPSLVAQEQALERGAAAGIVRVEGQQLAGSADGAVDVAEIFVDVTELGERLFRSLGVRLDERCLGELLQRGGELVLRSVVPRQAHEALERVCIGGPRLHGGREAAARLVGVVADRLGDLRHAAMQVRARLLVGDGVEDVLVDERERLFVLAQHREALGLGAHGDVVGDFLHGTTDRHEREPGLVHLVLLDLRHVEEQHRAVLFVVLGREPQLDDAGHGREVALRAHRLLEQHGRRAERR